MIIPYPLSRTTMFSVSSLKEKASQAKTAGTKSYSSARDKIASSGGPSAAKAKPPPPLPQRKASGNRRGDSRTVGLHTSSSDVPDRVRRCR
ncbi:hypothetical protein H4582DRAFT_2102076 [Lactarius indigo]|nr:hypothetical protein H4582DRAFT_2102076 [Lactarius indigo]